MAPQLDMNTMQVVPLIAETFAPFERAERLDAGKMLFREGEHPRGVYYVRDGEVDLVVSSRFGARSLRVAAPGQMLGVSCVVSNRPHDCSATARSTATVGFIAKEDFQRLLDEKPELWLAVLQMISSDIGSCWDCMRSLGKC